MGYRSDVRCIIYANKEEDFPAVKLWLECNYHPVADDPLLFEEEENNGTKMMVYSEESIKWYGDYPSIMEFERMLEAFDEAFTADGCLISGCFHFVRIGEDLTDIEEKVCNCDDYLLSVNRYIDWS